LSAAIKRYMIKMAKDKALVPTAPGNQDIAVADDFFQANAGAGLDNVTAADMLVPRLTILQSLSPQLKARESSFIEGAKVGDICDVGTGTLFPGTLLFLPVYYRKDYLEWAPRSSGGGLVQIHSDPAILEQTTRNDKKQALLPNGNLVAETAQFFGFNLSANRQMCFIPMASTQLKKARKWITLAASEKLRRRDGSEFTAPLFYRAYELGTADESNAQGDWSGWTINRGPALNEMEFDGTPWQVVAQQAAEFRLQIMGGEAKGDISDMNSDIEHGPSNGQEAM
jgi:hypothetical protein